MSEDPDMPYRLIWSERNRELVRIFLTRAKKRKILVDEAKRLVFIKDIQPYPGHGLDVS
jgi:hypothetical protein